MGALRFRVSRRNRLPEFAPEVAHVYGVDRCPWQGRTVWEDSEHLVHYRDIAESGFFVCPWITESGDWTCLVTASLREQAGAYQLERELARGTTSRVRELASQMQMAGVPIGTRSRDAADASQRAFLDHLAGGEVETACVSITAGLRAIEGLMADLHRFQQDRAADGSGIPKTLRVGTVVTPFSSERLETLFLELFDAVSIPVRWRDLEREDGTFDWNQLDRWVAWAKSRRRRILMGPLLRLDRRWLPDWAFLLHDRPIEILLRSVDEFIAEVVKRYRDDVDLWQSAAGLNVPGDLGLVSEDRLRVAATAIESVRKRGGKTPVVMRFDQPWSESLIRNELELPAFYFADALVRADLGLRGVGIDFHWGYWPGGSLQRDPLAVHMMLQRWSRLELPLLVGLAVPHHPHDGSGAKPLVLHDARLRPIAPEWQAQQLRMLAAVAASSPAVHGVAYNAFVDRDMPAFPSAGLIDSAGEPLPACRAWQEATQREPAS